MRRPFLINLTFIEALHDLHPTRSRQPSTQHVDLIHATINLQNVLHASRIGNSENSEFTIALSCDTQFWTRQSGQRILQLSPTQVAQMVCLLLIGSDAQPFVAGCEFNIGVRQQRLNLTGDLAMDYFGSHDHQFARLRVRGHLHVRCLAKLDLQTRSDGSDEIAGNIVDLQSNRTARSNLGRRFYNRLHPWLLRVRNACTS